MPIRPLALAVVASLTACSKPPEERGPLGALPTAVTSAEPQWIPFSIRAGKRVAADPRERRFLDLRQLTFDGAGEAPVWHPDGRQLWFEAGGGSKGCGHVAVIDLGSGEVTWVSPRSGWGSSPAFGPGARLLFAFGAGATDACAPRWAAPGAPTWTMQRCDVVSHDGKALVAGPSFDGELTATADGSRLAFSSNRTGDPEVYVAAADGSSARRVSDSPGYDGQPAFSHDGTKLVWQSEQRVPSILAVPAVPVGPNHQAPAAMHIVLAGADGQRPRVITKLGRYNITPAFLPDSRRVLFASDRDAAPGEHRFELYLIDPEGVVTAAGTPPVTRLTFSPGFDGHPRISPDGRWLAFTSARGATSPGRTNIFVARIAE